MNFAQNLCKSGLFCKAPQNRCGFPPAEGDAGVGQVPALGVQPAGRPPARDGAEPRSCRQSPAQRRRLRKRRRRAQRMSHWLRPPQGAGRERGRACTLQSTLPVLPPRSQDPGAATAHGKAQAEGSARPLGAPHAGLPWLYFGPRYCSASNPDRAAGGDREELVLPLQALRSA